MTRAIPLSGKIVIDPATRKALPPDGAEVEVDSYWIRRSNDGDVILANENQNNGTDEGN